MNYAKPDKLVELTVHDIRQAHPGISFPPSIEPHHVADLGYLPVVPDPEPELKPGETIQLGLLRVDGDVIRRGWMVLPAPPITAEDVAERRWRAEVGGITINGLHIDTDDRSKLLISGAEARASRNPDYVLNWKTPGGFVSIPAAHVLMIADAVADHVQACFDRESELLGMLDTLTHEMLEEGWPE